MFYILILTIWNQRNQWKNLLRQKELTDNPLVAFVNQILKKMSISSRPQKIPGLKMLFILQQNGTLWNYGLTLKWYIFLWHTNETVPFNNLLWFLSLQIQSSVFSTFFTISTNFLEQLRSLLFPHCDIFIIYYTNLLFCFFPVYHQL